MDIKDLNDTLVAHDILEIIKIIGKDDRPIDEHVAEATAQYLNIRKKIKSALEKESHTHPSA